MFDSFWKYTEYRNGYGRLERSTLERGSLYSVFKSSMTHWMPRVTYGQWWIDNVLTVVVLSRPPSPYLSMFFVLLSFPVGRFVEQLRLITSASRIFPKRDSIRENNTSDHVAPGTCYCVLWTDTEPTFRRYFVLDMQLVFTWYEYNYRGLLLFLVDVQQTLRNVCFSFWSGVLRECSNT